MCPWPDTVTLPEEERIIYGINDGTGIYRKLRRLHTKVYLFGKRVENFVDHPIIRPSINSVAMTYDLALDPQYQDIMLAVPI